MPMFVATAEERMIPGRRPELEAAHRDAAARLGGEPGFLGARLLHFAGGPYRYAYEMSWASREQWERFWESERFAQLREPIDAQLSEPFTLTLYNVPVDSVPVAEQAGG
jgi:heme-degrading monooxygenase HmoA